MKNRLDQDFTLGGLLRFALPTTIMMLVTSLYTIVDGVLTSRLVGENALAAINIAYPAISVTLAVGIMLGTGGSAVVAHRMGTGDMEGARRTFGFLALAAVCAGGLFALIGGLWPEELARLLGASDLLVADAAVYLRILLLFAPMAMFQLLFESFFVTAGRPGLGLGLTIGAGITNGVLDWLYMGPLNMGIAGAAIATVTGYCIPAVCGVAFFLLRKQGLRFGKPELRWRLLGRACFNGSSEMVTNLSTAVTTFCFNAIMLSLLGEPGVSAITIVLYAQFLLVALFLGFSMGWPRYSASTTGRSGTTGCAGPFPTAPGSSCWERRPSLPPPSCWPPSSWGCSPRPAPRCLSWLWEASGSSPPPFCLLG